MLGKPMLMTLLKQRGKPLQLCLMAVLLLRESRRAAVGFSSGTTSAMPPRYYFVSTTTRRFSSSKRDALFIFKQPIVDYHKDEEDHWVAELECGHFQHVRHNPPMMERAWVLTEEGRRSFLGYKLVCKKCFQKAPKDKPKELEGD